MKMIAGDFSLAKAKASRTSLAPSPVIRDRVLVFDCQAELLDFRVIAKGGFITESFSLWLKSPKKTCNKSLP